MTNYDHLLELHELTIREARRMAKGLCSQSKRPSTIPKAQKRSDFIGAAEVDIKII